MEQDSTAQALQQMEITLRNHTSEFEKGLQAIIETRTTLESKIGAVVANVGLLRADQRVLADRVSNRKVHHQRPMQPYLQTGTHRIPDKAALGENPVPAVQDLQGGAHRPPDQARVGRPHYQGRRSPRSPGGM
ncbi:hypothetical protein NDU88_008157 [Pleurodeles waltl]|uniref:Uncharacterized protein n=1 Tax=Pleurodeles waltl TaxID=8319 RepID=A0AAV7NZG2_PLEWA|nr:hypothetical protein NDU88_008157 [Pleurodeles waltl]